MTQTHRHPPGFVSYSKAKKKKGDGQRSRREASGIADAKRKKAEENGSKR